MSTLMKTLFPILIISCAFAGCRTPASTELVSCGYVQMNAKEIPDEIPLKSPLQSSVQDIALTFPVYEMGAHQTKDSILRGDVSVKSSESCWLLEGDGAQTSVELIRVSSMKETPLRVILKIGPRFEGHKADDFVCEYEFERIEGGWRKVSARKSQDSPLLSKD